jgi:putative membrane protein
LNPLWDIFFAALITAIALWYRSQDPQAAGVSPGRRALFYLALAALAVLTVGPVSHLAVQKFWVHMIQHVGIMMLISPLLVLGRPGYLMVNSKGNSKVTRTRLIANHLRKNKLFRYLFKPEVGFVIFLATLILTHFSPLANKAMVDSNFHIIELLLFLIAGIIYYYPVMSGNPTPYFVSYATRVISLFAMMLPETMTGFFLYSGNRLLHTVPKNSLPSAQSHLMAMNDQHKGGAIMWAMGMLIDSIWIVMAARDWFESEKAKSEIE